MIVIVVEICIVVVIVVLVVVIVVDVNVITAVDIIIVRAVIVQIEVVGDVIRDRLAGGFGSGNSLGAAFVVMVQTRIQTVFYVLLSSVDFVELFCCSCCCCCCCCC